VYLAPSLATSQSQEALNPAAFVASPLFLFLRGNLRELCAGAPGIARGSDGGLAIAHTSG